MRTWVKLYTEINRDPAIGTLTWAQRGIWSALLALAGELDFRDGEDNATGELDTVAAVAWHIRASQADLENALESLAARGMVDEREGVLFITNFGKRQRQAPSAAHERVAARVRQHRNASTAPRNEDETTLREAVTPSESDTDTDTEAEVGATATPPAPHAAPTPPPARTSKADPRTRHVAIQTLRGITGRLPPKGVYDRVIAVVGEHPDVATLRANYATWCERGYNPNAVTWATDWYPQGPPARGAPAHLAQTRGDGRSVGQRFDDTIREWVQDKQAEGAAHGNSGNGGQGMGSAAAGVPGSRPAAPEQPGGPARGDGAVRTAAGGHT